MGRAVDSVGLYRTSGGAADTVFSATTIATGDSFTVRAFQPPAQAEFERLFHQAEAGSFVRVRSPLLHDNVTGLQYYDGQYPSTGLFGKFVPQPVQPQDTFVVEMLVNAITTSDAAVFTIEYKDLPGANARLHTLGDILPLVKSIKPQRVQVTAAFTLGTWTESAWNNSENNLHANTDYAILGYATDTACCAVHVKGIDTSNLRIAGPGVLDLNVTRDYFVEMSRDTGEPHIPVVNSANIASLFGGYFDRAAHTTLNLTFFLAELSRSIG